MELGKVLGCHQMAERSFTYQNKQFPLCARCTGVLLASLVATPCFFLKKWELKLPVVLSSIMFFDWFIQFLHLKNSTNSRRFITGLLGGFGWTIIHLSFYRTLIQAFLSLIQKKIQH